MKKRIIPLLLLSLLLIAGNYNLPIHYSFGNVSVDSVWAIIQVDTTPLDTAKNTVFPEDTSFIVPDTAALNILFWWFYSLDNGTYVSTTMEIGEPPGPLGIYDLKVFVVDTTNSPTYDSISGVTVEIENATGHKYLADVTDDSGAVLFTVADGIWTIRSYGIQSGDTTKVDMSASDQVVLHKTKAKVAPAATATSDWVLAYADVTRGVIDTITGLYVGATDMLVKIFLVNADHFTNNAFIILPDVYEETPDNTGRVKFVLPANTKLSPPGSYYEMYFTGRRGRTLGGGMIKRFIVDTFPDPLDISTAASVR